MMRTPARCSGSASLSGVCPPVLDDAADFAARLLLARDDRGDVFEGERLEIQPVNGVVVSRDRFGIAVDHDGLESLVPKRERGMTAAVVELDPLPDPVRAAAQNHNLLPWRRIGFAFLLVGSVQIGRERFEFRGAGVDPFVRRLEPEVEAGLSYCLLVGSEHRRELAIGDARAFERPQHVGRHATQADERGRALQLHDLRELHQEPGIDLREVVQVAHVPAAIECAEERPHSPIVGDAQRALERSLFFLVGQSV